MVHNNKHSDGENVNKVSINQKNFILKTPHNLMAKNTLKSDIDSNTAHIFYEITDAWEVANYLLLHFQRLFQFLYCLI